MLLKLNQYPNSWVYSDECPSPPLDKWVDPSIKVAAFLATFCCPLFFGRIIVWFTHPRTLANFKAYKFKKKNDYKVIERIEDCLKLRYEIENSCEGAGHMCVLFMPKNAGGFLKQIIQLGYYGEPQEIVINTSNEKTPFDIEGGQDVSFFKSNIFMDFKRIFTFSHDAEFLYEIFVEST